MGNKGKVHPSPPPPPSHYNNNNNKDALSVLEKLLPAAIFTIASLLSLEDREVLAYMITRSIKSTNPSFFIDEKTKKPPKKSSHFSSNHQSRVHAHKNGPFFDCECFDCYTSFWFRWDSSPNRELIHQAIEEFEEHFNSGELSRKGKNRKKDKLGRRGLEKRLDLSSSEPEVGTGSPEIQEIGGSSDGNEVLWPAEPAAEDVGSEGGRAEDDVVVMEPAETATAMRGAAGDSHKGLARKVLSDVLGLFNSRLWNLWNPNV